MKIYSEAAIKKAKDKIIVNAPTKEKKEPLHIDPNNISISSPLEDYYNRAAKMTKTLTSPEKIKEKIGRYAAAMLEYFHTNLPNHPNTGLISGWKIEKLKADRIHGINVFAVLLDDSSGEGKRWFVLFKADDHMNPIYVEIETSKFNIDSFPMSELSKLGGYEHEKVRNKATEISEKQLFDTLSQTSQKKAEELGMDIGTNLDQEEEF